MAGQDQSVNLTGMLSSIAETLGSGYEIGGVSAGEALGNNIREAAKPKLDMKDPASIRKYAEWAGRNGKDEESLLMQQKAAEVEEELTYNKNMGEVRTTASQGSDYANAGEAELLQVRIKQLDDKARQLAMTSPEAAEKAQQAADSLRAKVGGAKQIQFGKQADHFVSVEKALKTGEWTGEDGKTVKLSAAERQGLEAQRDMYLRTKPAVVAESKKIAVDRAATDLVADEQRWSSEVSKKVFQAAKSGAVSVEEMVAADPSLKKYEGQMRDEYDRVRENQLRSDEVREAIVAGNTAIDTSSLQERVDALPEGLRQQQQEALDRLKGILGADGKRVAGFRGQANTALTNLEGSLAGAEGKVSDDNYRMGQASRVAANQGAAQLRVYLDEGTVTSGHLAQAEADLAGMDDSAGYGLAYAEASSDEERNAILYDIALENMEDAALRLEIRAGTAEPLRLKETDVDAANEALRDVETNEGLRGREAILTIAEEMLRDNFNPEEVQAWKKLTEEEMDQLNALIEADDEQRLQMAATQPVTGGATTAGVDGGPYRQVSGRERVGQLADWYTQYRQSNKERVAPLAEAASAGAQGLRENASDITATTGRPGQPVTDKVTLFSAQ